ncbi:MAG: restriction endonuclease subunit S [Holosporales bacterium]|jgi:hypothetical protein|nr:restriction endonuclease subunit S [Holosporales bacterium]
MSNPQDARSWKLFKVGDVFSLIKKSRVYHKTNLRPTKSGVPYISRTNFNNGLEDFCENENFKKNPANTIVFGAENATFFFQSFEYITGNSMCFIQDKRIKCYTGLFISTSLNQSIRNCGFGYGKGLTGMRIKSRYISLPIDDAGQPDWEFMENHMRRIERKLLARYKKYLKLLEHIENSERGRGIKTRLERI